MYLIGWMITDHPGVSFTQTEKYFNKSLPLLSVETVLSVYRWSFVVSYTTIMCK